LQKNIRRSADLQDPAPAMQNFVRAYQERFHNSPNFPALHAYEATRMILTILEKTTDPQAIRKELLKLEQFTVILANISVDRFGDLKYPHLHLAHVKNNQFVKVD
jgi:ABC-type branched-subunit amino acid transport system substrate-binding protein